MFYRLLLSLFFADAVQTFHCVAEPARVFHCVVEPSRAFHCVTEPSRAFHCVTEQLRAFHCVTEQLRAFHCVAEPSRAFHCVTEPLWAFHCVSEPLWAFHCVAEPSQAFLPWKDRAGSSDTVQAAKAIVSWNRTFIACFAARASYRLDYSLWRLSVSVLRTVCWAWMVSGWIILLLYS